MLISVLLIDFLGWCWIEDTGMHAEIHKVQTSNSRGNNLSVDSIYCGVLKQAN